MADYYSPTVVEPMIPAVDTTPLERLLLDHVFDVEDVGDGFTLSEWQGPSDYPEFDRETLAAALAASDTVESRIAAPIEALLSSVPDDDPVIVELDRAEASVEMILQDIVRRSQTLRYVSIICAFTCTKMRPDGFDGAVTLITAEAVRSKSTNDILGEFLDQAGISD